MASGSAVVRLQPRGPRGIKGAPPVYETDGARIRFLDPDTNAPLGPWVTVLGPPGPTGDATSFASKAVAEASAITPGQPIVRIAGYYAAAGGGGADYVPYGNSPPPQGALHFTNGPYYELLQRDAVNLQAIGAKGDGSNVADYLEEARDYALRKGLRTIIVPDGDYVCERQVDFFTSGFVVLGTSSAAKLIDGTTNQACLRFGNGTDPIFSCGVFNLSFGQKAGVVPVFGNCAVVARLAQGFMMDRYIVAPFPAPLYDGIRAVGFSTSDHSGDVACEIHIGMGKVTDCLNTGHHFERADGYLADLSSHANKNGYVFRDCAGLQWGGIHGYANSEYGGLFDSNGGTEQGNHFLQGASTRFDTNGLANMRALSLIDSDFDYLWASTGKDATPGTPISAVQEGMVLEGPGVHDVNVGILRAYQNNGNGAHIKTDGLGHIPTRVKIKKIIAATPGNGNGKAHGKAGFVEGFGIKIDDGVGYDAQPAIIEIEGGTLLDNWGDGTGDTRAKAASYSSNPTARLAFSGRIDGLTPLPLAAITPTGSPFSWRNGPTKNQIVISGGTVTAVAINGQGVVGAGNSLITLQLEPLDTITITYSSAPSIVQIPSV